MSRGMRFRETPATPEEDSYDYRVEWDGRLSSAEESFASYKTTGKLEVKNYGPGLRTFSGLDNAWDLFCDLRDNPDYIRVRLIQIDKDGNERVRNT